MDGKIIQEAMIQQGVSSVRMCTTRAYYGTDKLATLYCPFIPRLVIFDMSLTPSGQSIFIGANGWLIRIYNPSGIEYTYSNNIITCQGLGAVSTSTEYTLTALSADLQGVA